MPEDIQTITWVSGCCYNNQISTSFYRHQFKDHKILTNDEYTCLTGLTKELITRLSKSKVASESSKFLERLHGDICELIYPSCRLFWYYMVLIDVSTKQSYVSLLSTRNLAFARLLTQIICFKAQFPNYLIKTIRSDNPSEFILNSFSADHMVV